MRVFSPPTKEAAWRTFLERIDSVFLPYSLARFRFFAERMVKAAERFRQIVVLGCGYDTRPLWLPGLAAAARRS